VTAHQCTPGLFVERIEAERLLAVLDGIPEGSIMFEKVDKTRENLSRTLTETFPVPFNPLTRAVGEDVALVQTCRLMQGATVSRQAAIGGGLEDHKVHYRAGSSAPRERARARIDEGIQPGRCVSKVVQLAAQIGQCLGIARFRPEGACDPLTLDRSAAGMENQEGDELLLSRAWRTGGDTAVGENTESPNSSTRRAGGTATFQDYMDCEAAVADRTAVHPHARSDGRVRSGRHSSHVCGEQPDICATPTDIVGYGWTSRYTIARGTLLADFRSKVGCVAGTTAGLYDD
jgi:hypothetical protein